VRYRQLGNSGVRVSVIGLGTNRFGSDKLPKKEVRDVVDAALDHGINHIDTADSYAGGRSEKALGEALKGRWDRFVVASKFFFPVGDGPNDRGTSRYHMMNQVHGSLRRLQTDHIDIYYIHRWDETAPIGETLRGLDDLLSAGKIRYVGVSDFAAWQLAHSSLLAEVRGWAPISVIQSQYNMLERDVEGEVLPCCRAYKIGFVPYFPLAGGFLTGKYQRGQAPPSGSRGETSESVRRYMTPAYYDIIENLTEWAEKRGRALNELAQAWLIAQPQVCSVISGLTKIEHLMSNVKAADWKLSSDELDEIESILKDDQA